VTLCSSRGTLHVQSIGVVSLLYAVCITMKTNKRFQYITHTHLRSLSNPAGSTPRARHAGQAIKHFTVGNPPRARRAIGHVPSCCYSPEYPAPVLDIDNPRPRKGEPPHASASHRPHRPSTPSRAPAIEPRDRVPPTRRVPPSRSLREPEHAILPPGVPPHLPEA